MFKVSMRKTGDRVKIVIMRPEADLFRVVLSVPLYLFRCPLDLVENITQDVHVMRIAQGHVDAVKKALLFKTCDYCKRLFY